MRGKYFHRILTLWYSTLWTTCDFISSQRMEASEIILIMYSYDLSLICKRVAVKKYLQSTVLLPIFRAFLLQSYRTAGKVRAVWKRLLTTFGEAVHRNQMTSVFIMWWEKKRHFICTFRLYFWMDRMWYALSRFSDSLLCKSKQIRRSKTQWLETFWL